MYSTLSAGEFMVVWDWYLPYSYCESSHYPAFEDIPLSYLPIPRPPAFCWASDHSKNMTLVFSPIHIWWAQAQRSNNCIRLSQRGLAIPKPFLSRGGNFPLGSIWFGSGRCYSGLQPHRVAWEVGVSKIKLIVSSREHNALPTALHQCTQTAFIASIVLKASQGFCKGAGQGNGPSSVPRPF